MAFTKNILIAFFAVLALINAAAAVHSEVRRMLENYTFRRTHPSWAHYVITVYQLVPHSPRSMFLFSMVILQDSRILKMGGKGKGSGSMKMKSSKKTDAPTASPTITAAPTFSQFPSAEPSSSNYPSVSPTKSMKMGKSSKSR